MNTMSKRSHRPAGFILSDEVKTVTLTTEDKETAVVELTNKANEARLRKLDSHTKQPLANATIKVTDASGKVFYEGKTGADGYITMKELPAGKYTWQEIAAPDTYSIDPALYSFTIDAYGKVTGDVEFANDPHHARNFEDEHLYGCADDGHHVHLAGRRGKGR